MSIIREVFANNASSTLSAAISTTNGTSLSVNSAASFPTTGNFRIIIDSEIMLVTAVSGTTFTVVRGQEGTTAATHLVNAAVTHILTQKSTQLLLRDNVPYADDSTAPPFRLQDASGNILTSSSFTIVNGTNATVTDRSSGSISIAKPKQVSAGYDQTFLARSAPGTPYSVIVAMDGFLPDPSQFSYFGLGFRQSTTGHISLLCLAMGSGAQHLAVYHLTNPNTNTSDLVSRFLVTFGTPKWFKVTDDGTNLTYYVSHNGIDWLQIGQEARGTFFTTAPDQVGVGFDQCYNSTYAGAVSLLSWSGA